MSKLWNPFVAVNNVPFIFYFQDWGKELDHQSSRVVDFLEQLDKFIANLNAARGNMTGHVVLADTEYGQMLDNIKTANEYQTYANNSELIESLEELLAVWSKQIEQVG